MGCFLGSFILPRLADVKGRKPMFQIGLVLYIITVVGLLISTSKAVLYALLVVGGVSEAGRCYVGYVYAVEIMPKRHQNMAGLIIWMTFAICKVCICLYLMLSQSKEWAYFGYTAIIFASFSLVCTTIFLPESPRFLYSNK